ncbi:LPXTG cell wall anchor domain-containing protein [Streptococcus halichoeri]|uniref:LPXTG cell wall anchor domain-containing protein n=1 Tax=Streptococcus halichoeri TaxID=254785 RepID=UPI001359D4AF|nr:LPXTG cell wall anchor domain-containing protein [Streptococcus halichoeri]
MAKGHWGKKAVLASLVISAGLLSGQRTVKVEAETNQNLALAEQILTKIQAVRTAATELTDEALRARTEVIQHVNQDFTPKYKELKEKLEKITHEQRVADLAVAFDVGLDEIQKEKDKVTKLSQDLKNTTQQLSGLRDQFRLTVEKDEADKKKLEAERDAIKTQLTDSNKAKTELEAKMKALQTQADETAQNLQAEVEKGQAAVNKLPSEKQAAETQVAALTAEKEQLSKAKAEVEAQLQDQSKLSEADKAKLQAQLADVQAKITEKENAIKGLESKLTETTAKLENQSKLSAEDKAKLQHELQDLMAKLDMLKKEHEKTPDMPQKPEDQPKAPSTPETPQNPEVTPQPKPAPESKVPEEKPAEPKAPEKHSIPWTALTPAAPSTPKKPEIKPAPAPVIPEVKPGKVHPAAPKAKHGKAHHAATPATPHMAPSAQYAAQNTAAHLPQTGEAATSFFTAAALSVMASAGVLSLKRKKD